MADTDWLGRLEALHEQMTPGEWLAYLYANSGLWCVDTRLGFIVCGNNGPDTNRYSRANSEGIAALHNAAPRLLALARIGEAVVAYKVESDAVEVAYVRDHQSGEIEERLIALAATWQIVEAAVAAYRAALEGRDRPAGGEGG